MKNRLLHFVIVLMLFSIGQLNAQVTGTKNIPGDYADLNDAFTALNNVGVGPGGAIINIVAGNPQTCPTDGFQLGSPVLNASLSAANTLVIQGNGNIINAWAGTRAGSQSNGANDGMFVFKGIDYSTVQNLIFQESAGNTTNTLSMENAIAYYNFGTTAGTADGCQYNTVTGCTFNLNNLAVNGGAIFVAPYQFNSTTAATWTAGTGDVHRNLDVTNNNFAIIYTGVVIRGISGVNAQNFTVTNNTMANIGGGATTCYGLYAIYTDHITFSNNIASGDVAQTTTNYIAFTSTNCGGVIQANSNQITLQSGVTSSQTSGIYFSSNIGGNRQVNNNTITFGSFPSITSATIYVLYATYSGGNTNLLFEMNGNNISNQTLPPTTGTIYMFYNSASSGGTRNAQINNNIVTNITKSNSGTIYALYAGTADNVEIGNNTLSNFTYTNNSASGSASIYGIYASNSALGHNFHHNTISNINISGTSTSTTGVLRGIYSYPLSTTSVTIANNTINDLVYGAGTHTGVVSGIYTTSGATSNIFNNKLYNLKAYQASGQAYGYYGSSGTTVNFFNNYIGNLETPNANAAIPLAGIYIGGGTTFNLYFNTVYLNASSTGALFGSNALYASTTPTLLLQNNIFTNLSVPNGATGFTSAYRRSSTTLTTYAAASNNNLFYAGTPSANNVIYYDGTTAQSTLAAYKTLVSPRDALSVTENPPFISTTGSNATFLHISNATPTQIESGGIPVSGITDDYDGDVRNASNPDVGADEGAFLLLDINPPLITYTPLQNSCSPGATTLIATISDPSGVPTTGIGLPVLYWSLNSISGPFTASTGTFLGSNQYQFSLGAGSVIGDVVYYYLVAQDMLTVPNIGAFPSAGAGGFTFNPPATATPPTTPSSYTVIPTLSGTYTVGALGAYSTISAAVTAYNNSCVAGPVVFSLIDASYSESAAIVLNSNPGASAVNTLTIKPTLPNTTITVTGGSSSAVFVMNGADYVIIDGSISGTINSCCPATTASRDLTISNSSTSTSSAVIWLQTATGPNPATNITIKNCNLTGNGVTQTLFGVGSGSTTISTSSLGTNNNNNAFVNNNISGVQYGIYSQGASAANKNSGTMVSQNLINTSANTKGGIWLGYENGPIVSCNNVSNIAQSSSPDVFGITLGMGTSVSATTSSGNEVTNAIVTNNIIGSVVNSGTYSAVGIAVAAATSGNTLIANNMISGVSSNGTAGDFGAGIIVGGGTGSVTQTYFNSVSMQGTITGSTAASQTSTCLASTNSTPPVLDLKNNIFTNTQSGNSGATLRFAAIAMAGSSYTNLLSDYNDLYAAGAGPGTYTIGITGTVVGGTNSVTLSDWQTTTGKDLNSLNINPVFVSSTDLHLVAGDPANQSLICGGTFIASVPTDFDCESRKLTATIGGDEVPVMINANVAYTENSGTANDGFICAGAPVILTASGGDNYSWSTGATTAQITVIPTETTTYSVSVYDNAGCGDSTSVVINVLPSPVPTINGLASACAGSTNIIYSTEAGMTGYVWNVSVGGTITAGGGSNDYTVTVSWNNPGPQTVSVNYTGSNGCSATNPTIYDVLINPLPVPVISGPATACIYSDSNVYSTESGMSNYTWNISAGGTITVGLGTNSITVTWNSSGSQTVTVTYTDDNGCNPTVPTIKSVEVYDQPIGVINPAVDNICYGTSTTLTASGGDTFLWEMGQTTDAITVSPTVDTYYSVVITSNTTTCKDTAYALVIVDPLPIIGETHVEPTTCVSFNGSIDLTITGNGPYNYNWSTPDGFGLVNGIEDQINITVGSYFVTVTDANGCISTRQINLLGPGNCGLCPVITSLTTSVDNSCKQTNFTLTADGLTSMGGTYGISFIYSAAELANPYSGGSVLGTVLNGALTNGGTTAVLSNANIPLAGTYYLYAILTPEPISPVCRPFASDTISIQDCEPIITDPCLCKSNATTLTDGQFDEEITLNAPSGQNWIISAVTGLYMSNSPAPPAAPIAFPPNFALTEVVIGDGVSEYILTGIHVDEIGYSVTLTNGQGVTLSIGATCYYPNPQINGLNATYCADAAPVTLNGSATLGGPTGGPATGAGSFTINGDPATVFNPAVLGAGTHAVVYTYDAEDDVPNIYHPGCIQSVSQSVLINPVPTVNSVPSVTYCRGTVVPQLNFTGTPTGVVFNWTRTPEAIGLASTNGTGNIPSFVATNTGTSPLSSTFTVTPVYTAGGVTCTGASITFTITVNPAPVVNAQTNKVYCSGLPTGGITFSGTATSYTWTNTNTAIGLASSGTATPSILSWTPVNNTDFPVTGTIIVTPVYAFGGTTCTGTPISFTITVSPAPRARCANYTLYLDENGNATLLPANISNNSVGGTLSISQSSFNCSHIGNNNVVLTVTDACGQTSSCTAVVTVVDNILPEVVCPLNINQALDPGLCSAWLFWEPPVVTDNCPGAPVITQISGPASGSEFTLLNSPYTIEYEIYDANGNGPVYCSFTVRVTGYAEPTTTMACNDEVQISLDRDCSVTLNPDMFLEGGPYSCYNVFEIYVNAAGYENQNLTNLKVQLEPGTYMVTIIDPISGNNCMTTMVLKDKIPPTIECTTCPEGGIVGYGMPVSEYQGILSMDDYDILTEIGSCWNFDFGPLAGVHPIDVYKVTVDVTGAYNFAVISSWADAELAIYDQEIDPNNMCNGVIGGGNDNGPGYDPIASVVLTAGETYYIAVSNWSSAQNGTYTLTMNGDVGNVLHLDLPIYDPACTFAGCDPSIYTFPLPEVIENCGYTLSYEDEWVEGPYCGIYFLRRTYTATDHAGMSASCTMEYLFTGSGLEELEWPRNWDGITNNNPMIECSATYPKDQFGNPHPNYTGWPTGYDDSCDRIEVFYTDRVYVIDCGVKILRDWVVIDDCWGLIEEWTQIIRITDSTPPLVCGPEDLLVEGGISISTNGWSCTADYVVPEPVICDNCDETPGYTVSSSGGKVVYVNDLKRWMILDLAMGVHTITYTVYDWCGNSSEYSFTVSVYDGIPPTAVCEQYKQVSLTFDGISSSAKVWAESFNSGSHDSGCGPVWFKVLRTDGGCMSFNCDNTACTQQWFDDYVVYCCDDTGKDIMTTLRVFDVNPGPGPISPSRMLPGGDLYGRYNDCMATVEVDEKVPPTLFCEEITITCEDNTHPDHTGYPVVLSACGNYELKWSDNLTTLNTCNVGYFIRKWEIYVNDVKRGECNQRINVLETLPFDPLTIVFPYISQESCLKEEPAGGSPTWEINPCNIVDASIIKIDTFRFVEGACYKILREWAVVDWCTYKPNTGAEWNLDEYRYISNNRRAILDPAKFSLIDRDGYYRFTEVIMVYDNTPANIEVEEVCLGVSTCVTSPETYTITANSYEDEADCGGEYEWTYVVKDECCGTVIQYSSNNNAYKGVNYQGGVMGKASFDKLQEANASFRLLPSLPMGRYYVTWTLSDGCGNVVQAEQWIEVVDKKPPTPFLVDISTAYMDNCMVEVTAIIFDKGACDGDCLASYDNCSEVLYFTYTPVLPKIDATWVLDAYGLYYFNPVTGAKSTRAQYLVGNAHSWDPVKRSSGRVFGIDAQGNAPLPVVEVDVYVWDQFALNEDCDDGNYDFATVTLVLNDEGDDCGAEPGSLVSGTVSQAITEQLMKDVEVLLDNGSPEYPWRTNTNAGDYQFSQVRQGEYWMNATKEDSHANGINTLDLIMIQRYLLGIGSNWNVYNLIAADANESGHISGGDILTLRNLILGMNDQLPGGRSWIFLEKAYEFANPSLPWDELKDAEKLDIEVSTNVGGKDFVGVKIGDINMTAYANADDQEVEVRNIDKFEIEVEDGFVKKGEVFELNFYNATGMDLYGLQWTLGLNGVELIEVKEGLLDIREEMIGRISGEVVTMSWYNIEGVSGNEGSLLFSLKVKALKDVNKGDCVQINSTVTRSEAYVGKDLEIVEPSLNIRGREEAFSLYQNEPNPFSGETVIGFELPVTGKFTLKIVDLNGKLLKEIQGEGVKGYNKVTVSGKELITGVLYYQLESGEYYGVRKMILVQ